MKGVEDDGSETPVTPVTEAEPSSRPGNAWAETKVVGKPLPRVDAWERVTGQAVYARDFALPDMLHAAILRCPHAHARVSRVDVSRAASLPGVRAVLTAGSPGASIPWYPGEAGPTSMLFDPHCRYQGEEVAAVAAETPWQAHDAVRAIEAEFEVLPFVVDMERALDPGVQAVHDGGNRQNENVVYTRGDVDSGIAEADVVVEATFRTGCQIHTPMETHGSVASWDGSRLTVWDTTQGVFDVRAELASALGLPLANVRVISHYMGGGFGSKIGLNKHTVIAALLSRATGRPVKLFLSREETLLCVGNRPETRITIAAAAKREGTLTALRMHALGTGGAYPYFPTSGYLVGDLYSCPNVRIEHENVYINAGRGRAFRAPGFPPTAWALEQVMDELARRLDIDPVALRLAHVPEVSQARGGMPYTSTGLADCLREGARAFGWEAARARPRPAGRVRRGVGVAAGMWGYPGEPNATALVTLHADGSVILNTGASDIGTGTKTVLAQVVAEELAVPIDRIAVENADTGTTHYAPTSGGSQTVLVNAPAVRAAALDVKAQLLELAAAQLGRPADELALADGAVVAEDGTRLPLAEIEALAGRQSLVGVGRRDPLPEGKVALPFAAQFAEVEVDTTTGEVRVVRMLGAHDSGRVMNLLTYQNQVFGGITMGLGLALTEARVLDPQTGRVLTANWHDYKVPTMLDVPAELICVPVDPLDTECNTVGAKGLGEPAHIPAVAAIGNAVFDAIGVRMTDAPMTPARVLAALASARDERGGSPSS